MSWIDCINPFNNPVSHAFFRHIPSDKRFYFGDASKLCPICAFEAHSRNNPIPISNAYGATLKNPDSKPEKDSL